MPQWYLTTFLWENKATRWILTKFPRCDRVNLCICEVKGSRSYFSNFSFMFHLEDRHSKDVNFKFHLKQSSNFVHCSCLYLILCKLKGALDKYDIYIFISTSIESFEQNRYWNLQLLLPKRFHFIKYFVNIIILRVFIGYCIVYLLKSILQNRKCYKYVKKKKKKK